LCLGTCGALDKDPEPRIPHPNSLTLSLQVIPLGHTHISRDDLRALIADLAATTYTPAAYRLLGRAAGGLNCNDFADDLAQALTGRGIPAHITSLPSDVLATPFGAAISPMLGGLEAAMSGMSEVGGAAAAAAGPTPASTPAALAASLEEAAGGAAVADAPAAAAEAAASPRAAAALRAEERAPSLAAAEAAVASAVSVDPSAARASFEALIRREFDAALAAGAATPNEAARLALERAAEAVKAGGERRR
jgi:hypothetical protein